MLPAGVVEVHHQGGDDPDADIIFIIIIIMRTLRMDILMIIDAIIFFSLQNVLDYEGDVEADMCMTFQVVCLACFFLYAVII